MDLFAGGLPLTVWDRPHATIDKLQERDKLGRIGQARHGPPRPARKTATYDDFEANARPRQKSRRLPHVGAEDDNDLPEVRVLKRTWHLPDNVKILEKPAPVFMTRSQQSAMLIKPPSVLTLKSMESSASAGGGGGAALGNTNLNVPEVCEAVIGGTCNAIRITSGQAQEDDLVSLQQAVDRRHTMLQDGKADSMDSGVQTMELQGQFLSGLGGDAFITALPQLPALQHLSLARSALPSSSIDPIAQALLNNTLLTLDLTGAGIDDSRAEELSKGLKQNDSLVTLAVPGNQIFQAGALHLTHALKRHRSLQRLDLSLNRIGDQGATWVANLLAESPPNLTHVTAEFNSISDTGGHSVLAMLAHRSCVLQSLSLRGNQLKQVRFEACQAIMLAKSLQFLNLGDNQISNMVLLGIAVLRSRTMRVLIMSNNQLTDSSFTSVPSTRFRYWETTGDKPARIRAWLLELAERTVGNAKMSKLELMDLSHNQISDDGAVIVVRSLIPLRQKQRKLQRKDGTLLPDGRVRRGLPRIILEQNHVQSAELLDTLRLLDSNVAQAESHWQAYTQRRKHEFWDDWSSKYGVEAQKRRAEHLWFVASNSRAGMVIRRKLRVLMRRVGRVGGDVDMDDDGMDEIELAEEEHGLKLLALKAAEEEAHAAEEAKAKKTADRQSRAKFEVIRAEYEKTGDAGLLKGLSAEQQAAAIKYRTTHAHKSARASANLNQSTPRSNREHRSHHGPRSNLNSPLTHKGKSLRSSPLGHAAGPNLMHS